MAERCNSSAGILDLMRSGQVGQRQVQKAGFILKHQAVMFLADMPLLTKGQDRRTHPGGLTFDHGHTLVRLRADHDGDAAFDDASLFKGDLGHGVAEKLLMIQRDGGDDRQAGRHHIGGVQTSAETHLEQGPVGRGAGKGQKGGAGGDFEKRDAVRAVGLHAFIQQGGQRRFADQRARNPDAFVKAGKVGRGIGVDAGTGMFHAGAHHGLGRAFAIGARDMDHGRQAVFRIAKGREEPVHAVERQVDDLGVQGHHAVEYGVGPGHFLAEAGGTTGTGTGTGSAAAATGAGRSPLMAGGWPLNIRRMVVNSSRRCLRWVTRSSMP